VVEGPAKVALAHAQARLSPTPPATALEDLPIKQSAGTLLYREGPHGLEVLLVHPSGSYNRHAPWSIPKGLIDGEESAEDAARRETLEETGVQAGSLIPLSSMEYRKSRKRVHCFAGLAPADAKPHLASWEIDRAEFVPLDEARNLLHVDQQVFLDRLLEALSKSDSE
jgi:predicted NUDIX family NTP pyrophosphohydrolase